VKAELFYLQKQPVMAAVHPAIPLQAPQFAALLWQIRSRYVHDECPLPAIDGHWQSPLGACEKQAENGNLLTGHIMTMPCNQLALPPNSS
jgi:hypothetical protein